MKRKILIVIYFIITVILIKLIYNMSVNTILINKYNDGEYSTKYATKLKKINYIEKYIASYNYGNILYQNGDYDGAMDQYEEALRGNVPKYKECNIRINYALAICKTVTYVDETDEEAIKAAISTYESAIDVLTEDGCANKNDNNGHNQKAEQLKKDIQAEIDRLKKLLKNDDNKNNSDNKDNNTSQNSEDIETKMQEIKGEATKEQREIENQYKNYKEEYNYDRKTKNW